MGYKHIDWHDEWIIEHINDCGSYKKLMELYNTEFKSDISLSAIKNHSRIVLSINKPRESYRHYTEEQISYLKERYENYSNRELLDMFNEYFNEKRTMSSIKNFGQQYGLYVNKELRKKNRRRWLDQENSLRATKQPGDTRIEQGRLVMKDENGNWKSAAKVIWEKENGQTPEGCVITVLDGNNQNINLENLACIPIQYMGLLQKNHLRSENPIITKTGIEWCRLKVALDKGE